MRANAAVGKLIGPGLAGTELDPSEYDVLVTLVQGSSEGLRPTELAQHALLTKSGMTRLVDRLVDRGLVERRACPSDRRGQLIGLTQAGRRRLRRAAPAVLRGLRVAMGSLSVADLAALKRAAERIERAAAAGLELSDD